jgi:hypothetical protein
MPAAGSVEAEGLAAAPAAGGKNAEKFNSFNMSPAG